MHRSVFLAPLVLLTGCATHSAFDREDGMLTLNPRSRLADKPDELVTKTVGWHPHETAIIICDMWDDHWCRGAAKRVAELAGPMNEVVKEARQRGVFIIHAPSSVTGYYDGTPQRERARNSLFVPAPIPLSTAERWGTTWCWPDPEREPALPIDDSDMGCDCADTCQIREAWSRQIATLEIDEPDAITDSAQETYNLLVERGIENVMLIGVHLNMCVLGRPFGIRQMVYLKKNTVFARDLTDTMYNSKMKPYVNHFDGTDLVVAHIEQHWCPSITSSDITGNEPFRFMEDRREPVP